MQYVYVLKSKKDKHFYVGRTNNLKQRLAQHDAGYVDSTKERRPLQFVYAEMSQDIRDADRREKYLKSAWGKRYLKNRLKNDIA